MNNAVKTRDVEIVNRKGLHARASAKLAGLATDLPVKVLVSHDGESADARSIMDLLCLGAGIGSIITLQAEGEDADAALDAVVALIADGFGELSEERSNACK
jgi:phosphocarrier protein